jgi:hypothetical protein
VTPMMVLAGVLIALVLIALTGIVVGVLIVRAIYKRIRRNRALNGAMLRTRATFAWGPQQQVLKLRLRLNDSLDSGQAAVQLALHGNGPRGELVRLFRRIQSEGVALEAQLRLLESETDTVALTAELPSARSRVEQIEGLVRQLRSAVSSDLGRHTRRPALGGRPGGRRPARRSTGTAHTQRIRRRAPASPPGIDEPL